MKKDLTSKQKRHIGILLIGVFALQILVFALISFNPQNTINAIQDDNSENTFNEKAITAGSGILSNLTREGANLVLKNESNPILWSQLHGKHINNLRIGYLTEGNEWKLVPFQLDEKAYLRTYKYEIGFHATAGAFGGITNVDLVNWVRFDVRHGYVGRHIDDTSSAAYEDAAGSTQYDAEMSIWPSRQQENWQDGDAGNAPTEPVQDPREQPGGAWEQLPRKIDYDDELVFPVRNGKQASIYTWWNYEEYPNRYRIKITDPVDGGQSWMYIYYNDVDTENPPNKNHFIPAGEKSYVNWDKENLKITAENYDLQFDPDNLDLYDALKIKQPNLAPNDLLESSNKQYLSIWFNVYYDAGDAVLDVDADTEVWREGQWDEAYYNEQFNAIGYGIDLDFSWGSSITGERTHNSHPDGNDPVTQGYTTSSNTHSLSDTMKDHWMVGEITAGDQDRDGITSETLPMVRGWFRSTEDPDTLMISKQSLENPQPFSGSHEAAIDGPVRTVLDLFSVQVIRVDLGSPVYYEEMWTITHETLKFEADGIQHDPYILDLDMSEEGGMELQIMPHFAFMFTERYSEFVRNDPDSFIALGRAPNGVPGLPNFQQCDAAGKSKWTAPYANNYDTNTLILHPDGNGANDDVVGQASAQYPNNPSEGHYDNSRLVTGSQDGNPLSDWKYLHTSSGGMWSYIPYQEWWQLFTTQTNRDLSTYWNDNGQYSESGLYANHGDLAGSTGEFIRKYVFGNFSYWESLREYARMKYNLNDHVEYIEEIHPGGPIFEGSTIFINGEQQTGSAYVKNGDQVNILLDMDSSYDTSLFIVSAGNFTSTEPDVNLHDAQNYIYNISLIVDSSNPDRLPPLSGYQLKITINTAESGYYIEELYLDNNPPTAPSTFTAEQPSASQAQVDLAWSGAADNGNPNLIDYYRIFRNGQPIKTLDTPASAWTDSNVLNGQTYTYFIRVFDMVGHYSDSATQQVEVNMAFTPATPAPLPAYFNDKVIVDWTSNPGDTDTIDAYRVHWAKSSGGPYTPLSWVTGGTTYEFDPTIASPQNGTYYLKLESYDSAGGGVSIQSGWLSSLYDTEKPISGVITDVPDDYHPLVAEIPVEWGGYFDAFSGIDYFELYRNENGGVYSKIGDFTADQPHYYDTNIANGVTYRYYVRTFDKAGNYDDGPIELVQYYSDMVGAEPNLKISSVEIDENVQERGSGNTFTATVTVNNIGNLAGSVDSIWLKFGHPTFGNVSYQYTIGTGPSSMPRTINELSSQAFTFSGCFASSTAYQGQITVDAAIRGSNSDNNADTTDKIWIRDFQSIIIDSMMAQSPVETGTTGNWINMTFTNPMITSVNITSYTIDITGFTEGSDYSINNIIGPDVLPNGYMLSGGQSADVLFYVEIDEAATPGTYDINGYVNGYEILTTTSVDQSSIAGTNWEVTGVNLPPNFFNALLDPNPLPNAGILTIESDVIDPDGTISSVSANVYNPSGSLLTTTPLTLSLISGDLYRGTWDSSGQPLGNNYYVIIEALDNMDDSNSTTLYFSITDQEPPSVNIDIFDSSVAYGSGTQTVRVTVTDDVGLRSTNPVQVRFYRPDNSIINTYTMTDIGGDQFEYVWNAGTNAPGEDYWFRILAYDTSNNLNNTEIEYFNIIDDQNPSITIDTFDNSAAYGTGNIDITATITDNHQVDEAIVEFHRPGGNLIGTFTMNNPSGDTYTYSWNVGTQIPDNNYYFTIIANDTVNNLDTATRNFDIIDNIQPTIVINFYNATVEYGTGSLYVNATVTDDYELRPTDPVEIQIYNPLGTIIQGWTAMANSGGDEYIISWDPSTNSSDSNYYFRVRATDNASPTNTRTTANQYFDIGDGTPPEVTIGSATTSTDYETGEIHVNVTATDNQALRETNPVQISFYQPGGTSIGTFNMIASSVDDEFWYVWDVGTYAPADDYYFTVTVYDTSENSFTTNEAYFDIVDDINPSVEITDSTDTAEYGSESISISATITDNYQLDLPVLIRFYYPNSTIINTFSMTNPSGNTFIYSWNTGTTPPNTSYFFRIIAQDASPLNNVNNTEIAFFNIVDTTAPTISSPGVNPTQIPQTESAELFATVTDSYKLQENNPVTANIYDPSGTFIETVILTKQGQTNKFNVSWDSSGNNVANGYIVEFNATDFFGNIQLRNVSFNIITGVPPSISNPQIEPTDLELDFNLTISCNASIEAPHTIESVIAQIYDPLDALIDTISLNNIGGTGFSGQWNSTGQFENNGYYVIINVTASNDVSAWTSNLFFNIIRTPPTIHSVELSTDSLEYNSIISIMINVSDIFGIQEVIADIFSPSDDKLTMSPISLSFNGTSELYEGTWDSATNPVADNYYVIVNASNIKDYREESLPTYFNIVDTTRPEVIIDDYSSAAEYQSGSIYLNATVTDNYQLNTPVQVRFFRPNDAIIGTYDMFHSYDDNYWYVWEVGSEIPQNNYYFQIIASDTEGNTNNTELESFNILDTVVPEITILYTNNEAEYLTGEIDILVSATDNYQLRSTNPVQVSIYHPNGTLIGTYNMNFAGGNQYSYNWSVGSNIPDSSYYYIVRAYDTSDNEGFISEQYFDIEDTVLPTIGTPSYNTPVNYLTGTLTVDVTASDNYKLRTINPVNISIYRPTAELIGTFAMELKDGDNFQYNWSVGSSELGDNYYFVITGIDNQSNTRDSSNRYFNIRDLEEPQVIIDQYDGSAEYGIGKIGINVSAWDNYLLRAEDPVEIRFYTPSDDLIGTFNMVNSNGNNYWYVWNVGTNPLGVNYYLTVTAYDHGDRTNTTDPEFFNIVDTTPPISENATTDETIYTIGEDIIFTIDVIDIPSGIDSVEAGIYNESHNLMATETLTAGSGNSYTGAFTTAGYSAGSYYFVVEATDNVMNSGEYNTSQILEIYLTEIVSLELDFANITVNTGYIGEDTLTFVAQFRAYDSQYGGFENVADINITSIAIQFGESGEYNDYFTSDGYNISLTNGLVLTGDIDYTTVEIYCGIDPSASMVENIGPIYVIIDYYEISSETPYTTQRTITGINIIDSVSIYEVPQISSLTMDIGTEEEYIGASNRIEFEIYGTRLRTEGIERYRVYLDLSIWDCGETIVEATWRSIGSHYFYAIDNLDTGSYNAADIEVIINTTIAGFREDTSAQFTGEFNVDASDPIINLDDYYIPSTTEGDGFFVYFNVTDNASLGVVSGIDSVSIQVSSDKGGLFLVSLTKTDDSIWSIYLSQDNLNSETFQFHDNKITIQSILAIDFAGNSKFEALDHNVVIVDETAPTIDFDSLKIDGLEEINGKMQFPANQYLSLKIKIDDGDVSSSGIYYVRVYFSIEGESTDIETSSENEWHSIDLAHLGEGVYFGVLNAPNQVGFNADHKLNFYFEISDFEGNVMSTKDDLIEIEFSQELPIVSYIVLGGSLICFIGALVYRIGFYRKKATILDIDTDKIKRKM